MDVRCDRCATEYDFDDALVSERGTTVKCTNCGHQFKVFPARTLGQPERWVVGTAAGRQLVYTSLRDLQKGIAEGQVGPEDQLSRGGQPPRPLGAIAELEPFFRLRRGAPARIARTITGVAPPPEPALPAASAPASEPKAVAPASRSAAATAPVDSAAPKPPFLPSPSNRPPGVHVEQPDAARARVNTAPRLPPESNQRRESPETVRFGASDSDPPTVRRNPLVDETAEAVRSAPQRPQAPAFGSKSSPPVSSPPRPASNPPKPIAAAASVASGGDAAPSTPRVITHPPPAALPETPRQPTTPRAAGTGAVTAPETPRVTPPDARGHSDADVVPPAAPAPAAVVAVDSLPVEEASSPVAADAGESDSDVALRLEADRVAADAVEMLRAGPSTSARASRAGPDTRLAEEFFTPSPREVSIEASLTDPDYRFVPPSRAREARARWVVALVMLGALSLAAGTVGVRWLRSLAQPKANAASEDPRLTQLVAAGNRALEDGDLDAARDHLMKASALAENEPALLAALARLETVRADLTWLKLRLLDPADTELVKITHRTLGSRVGKARLAVDAAARALPDDRRVLRARVDALRIAGDLPGARAIVGPLAEQASDPANAYVLGALDLAESSPRYRAVIERLRTSAAGEGELGLARAALVYALAMSGDVEAARSEFRRLGDNAHPHALAQDLASFLRRFENVDAGSAIGSEIPTIDVSSLGVLDTRPAEEDRPRAPAGDFRVLLNQANDALHSKDLARADQLYRAVLARQPENTEALAGLAEVARQRNDPAASRMIDDVLARNPNYLPALVSSADQKWSAGDRAGALTLYRRILDEAGAGSAYGQHAAARIAEARGQKGGTKAGDARSEPPAPGSARAAPTTTAAPPPEHPEIDTTDLPGF